MFAKPEPKRSCPNQLLFAEGTSLSRDILEWAMRNLSDEELTALEDDIVFFDQTGLVGLYMTEILLSLPSDAAMSSADSRREAA